MQEHGARAGEILSDDRVQDSTGETNRVSLRRTLYFRRAKFHFRSDLGISIVAFNTLIKICANRPSTYQITILDLWNIVVLINGAILKLYFKS
jgi:hypothetical protein